METVFDVFPETAYTFLQLNQGGARGNSVKASTEATGVFKERNGMTQNNNLETKESSSTLHIHPNEPFIATLQAIVGGNQFLVGQGVRVTENGFTQEYRIQGQVAGKNFDTNELEFYLLTLKAEKLVGSNASSS